MLVKTALAIFHFEYYFQTKAIAMFKLRLCTTPVLSVAFLSWSRETSLRALLFFQVACLPNYKPRNCRADFQTEKKQFYVRSRVRTQPHHKAIRSQITHRAHAKHRKRLHGHAENLRSARAFPANGCNPEPESKLLCASPRCKISMPVLCDNLSMHMSFANYFRVFSVQLV